MLRADRLDMKKLLHDSDGKVMIGSFLDLQSTKNPDKKVKEEKTLINFEIFISPVIVRADFVSDVTRKVMAQFMNSINDNEQCIVEIKSMEDLHAFMHNIKIASGMLDKGDIEDQITQKQDEFIHFSNYQRNILNFSFHGDIRIPYTGDFHNKLLMLDTFLFNSCRAYEIYTHRFYFKVRNHSNTPVFYLFKKLFDVIISRKDRSLCYLRLKGSSLPSSQDIIPLVDEIKTIARDLKKLH